MRISSSRLEIKYNPADCPCPRRHYLGVESAVTGAPTTHDNLPAAENW